MSSGTDSDKTAIQIDYCNKIRVLANLRSNKVKVEAKTSLPDAVSLLTAHYETKRGEGVAMAVCDRCNAMGPEALDACPFCGEPNNAPESSAIGGGDSEADSIGTIERGQTALARVPPGQSAFVRTLPTVVRPVPAPTEDALEVAVGNIQRFKRTFAENSWDIGHQLALIQAETKERPALWRQRKEDDGVTPSYDSFKAFLRAECGFSVRMAMGLILIATEYTREQVTLSGTAKIEIVLNAPEHERKKLLAEASTTPLRELRQKVKSLNIAAGKGEGKRKARAVRAEKERAANPAVYGKPEQVALPVVEAAPKGAKEKPTKAAPASEKSNVSTVVLPKAKGKIWLYRKQKDSAGKLTKAHSVTDNFGWIEGVNGTKLVFSVAKDAEGKLFVQYEAKREA